MSETINGVRMTLYFPKFQWAGGINDPAEAERVPLPIPKLQNWMAVEILRHPELFAACAMTDEAQDVLDKNPRLAAAIKAWELK